MQNFVHLRLHTEFSITDGILHVKDAIKLAQADQMFALAMTDLQNMFGLVKFYKGCLDAGVKPIIGAEVNVAATPENGSIDKYKILILAKNIKGYQELSALITRSYTENKILDVPYIKEEWLLDKSYHNLIILSGAKNGDIGQLILQHRMADAVAKLHKWQASFPDSYYLELQRINHASTNFLIKETIKIAHELDLPVVATHPIQFGLEKDYLAHELRVCIAEGEQIDNEKREIKFTSDQYLKSQKEMQKLFSDIPSAINNTLEIAKRCNVEITLGKYFLPDFATPDKSNLEEYLSILANNGLANRLCEIYPDEKIRQEHANVYEKRLEIEIETIVQMGFSGYFLIVADFINWAKQNNIPVGPGRGSGAGSLVAFVLGITDVEPLRYGLLFERFLNSERVSMPDFDIDFCQDKRELVIEYVQNKYGKNAVSQIATFGTMASKAVIKDVGRVLGLPYGLCDSLTKSIMNTPAKSYSLLEAYDKFPDLKDKIDTGDEDVKRLWELSLQLEDLVKSVGKHAAGVLIAPGDLSDFCPLYLADGMQTSQLDKDDVEAVGLVKFDFLGLRNLTTIAEALENIKSLYNIDVILSNYEFNDEKTYKLLQSGNSGSVFQLESGGMRRVLTKLEPDRFEDIIALLALYRPGPLGSGMVDDFIRRKKGEAIADYFHPDLRECLEPTYGVIVYQEQVMQISQIIGGYTLGGADLLRRAMGKKKPEEMALHKGLFIEGALKKGYSGELAENLFDLMAMFAEYGFNKSHSAAYAVISYHTAYLKAHYLTCFMSSTMSSELDNTDKLYELYQDCLDNDIKILPPDVNKSINKFLPVDEKTIRYGLGALKGVGSNVINLIVTERNSNGEFTGFIDFCERVDKKVINKKALESLIKGGAFDNFDSNRAKLFNNIAKVLDALDTIKQNENQGSLFDAMFDDIMNSNNIELDDYPSWTLKEQLLQEKQALGFYFSGSLFDEYKDIVKKLGVTQLSKYNLENEEMQDVVNNRGRDRQKIFICGVINYIGYRPLKNGGKMAFVNIEDDSSDIEVVLFNNEHEKFRELLKMDEMIFVEGELTYDSFRNQIKATAKQISVLDDVLATHVEELTLHLQSDLISKNHKTNIDVINAITPMLANSGAVVRVNYTNETARCRVKFGKEHCFIPTYDNISRVNQILGKHGWEIN